MSYKTIERTTEQLTKEDFASDQMVRGAPVVGIMLF